VPPLGVFVIAEVDDVVDCCCCSWNFGRNNGELEGVNGKRLFVELVVVVEYGDRNSVGLLTVLWLATPEGGTVDNMAAQLTSQNPIVRCVARLKELFRLEIYFDYLFTFCCPKQPVGTTTCRRVILWSCWQNNERKMKWTFQREPGNYPISHSTLGLSQVFVCLHLLLNGTSLLVRLLVPRIVKIKHMRPVKNDV